MNLLAPEPEIIARLKAAIAAQGLTVGVYGVPDLPAIQDDQHLAPAVFVVFNGVEIAQSKANGAWVVYRTTWTIVPVVRNRRDPKTGTDSREEAGALMTLVAQALQGHKPAKGWTALEAASPVAGFFDVGFAYYPLAFSTSTEIKGDTQE